MPQLVGSGLYMDRGYVDRIWLHPHACKCGWKHANVLTTVLSTDLTS